MNSLVQVQRHLNWSKSTYIKLLIKKDSAELEAIKNFLSEKNLVRREDYEIESAIDYEVYVNQLFDQHNPAKFSKVVKSLSIIPITLVNGQPKIVLSKKMRARHYIPLTINWGENIPVNQAIDIRIKEEFDTAAIKSKQLKIDCKPLPYYNTCIPKYLSNTGITRKWTYHVAFIANVSNPDVKYCSLDEFISNINQVVDHFWLGHELEDAIDKLIN